MIQCRDFSPAKYYSRGNPHTVLYRSLIPTFVNIPYTKTAQVQDAQRDQAASL